MSVGTTGSSSASRLKTVKPETVNLKVKDLHKATNHFELPVFGKFHPGADMRGLLPYSGGPEIREWGVGRKNRQTMDHGLGGEEAIEGVTVV